MSHERRRSDNAHAPDYFFFISNLTQSNKMKKNEKAMFVEILSGATSVEKVTEDYSVATATSANGSYTFGVDRGQSLSDAAKEWAKRYRSQIQPVKIPNGPTKTAIFLQIVSNHREIAVPISDVIVYWTVNSTPESVIYYAVQAGNRFAQRLYDDMSSEERNEWLRRMKHRAINETIYRMLNQATQFTDDYKLFCKLGREFDYSDRVSMFPRAWLS